VCTSVLLFYLYIAIFKILSVSTYWDRRNTSYTEKEYNGPEGTSVSDAVALRKASHHEVLPAHYRKCL